MTTVEKAIQFAVKAHEGVRRKGTNIPYILHPLDVAAICAQLTEDEDVIAAAALHDVIEDTSFTENDLREQFGDRVTGFVMGNSENKRRELPAQETWLIRKQETLEHLKSASIEVKTIAFADKLSNLRSTVVDYTKMGESFWERFQQKDLDLHLWYYAGVCDACEELDASPLYLEYDRYLRILGSMIREYKDFGGHDDNAIELLSTPQEGKWVFRMARSNDVLAMTEEEFQDFLASLRQGSGTENN